MNWLLICLISIISLLPYTSSSLHGQDQSPVIIGYLPEYRYFGWNSNPNEQYRFDAICQHLTHLILFSLEVSQVGTLAALERFPDPDFLNSIKETAKTHNVSLMISLGGNGRTNGFPRVSKSLDISKKFARNLVEFIEKHELDGVDFNWEYPTNEAQWKGLANLVKFTRNNFDSKEESKNKIVSIAYYPGQEKILQKLNIPKWANFLLAMSYDYQIDPSRVGPHPSLEFAQKTIESGKAVFSADFSEKMVLGVPIYGRHKRSTEAKSYEDLLREKLIVPEVDDGGIAKQFYYDSRNILKEKIDKIKQNGIRGLMLWELGQDAFDNEAQDLSPHALLKVISGFLDIHTLKQNGKAKEESFDGDSTDHHDNFQSDSKDDKTYQADLKDETYQSDSKDDKTYQGDLKDKAYQGDSKAYLDEEKKGAKELKSDEL